MKKLLMALVLLPLMAAAETEVVDGIEWTYAIIGDKAQVGDGLSTNPAIPSSTVGAITIPSTLGGYPVTSIGDYAFYRCAGLMQVIIPDGVTDIGFSAFYKCEKLDKIDLPSSLRSIDAGLFWGCRALTSISIPAGVVSIGSSAFAYCSALTTITVDPENRHYMATGNCLYTKDGGSLLLYRGNSSKVEIPASVLNIGGAAFSTCGFVTIEIPLGVTNIGVRAFAQCSKLTAVTIPKSVTCIEERIFDECYALRTVYVDVGDVDRMRKMLYEAHPEYGTYFDNVSIIELSATSLIDSPLELLPGEAVSVDTGLVGYTAKGLPSGLKYDKKTGKITGAAKKPTAAEGVTVKFTKRNEPDAEIQIVVGPMPTLSIALEGDTEKCKVKGAGAYLVGKKVSLSATAPKGTAFVGWFANGAPWPNESDCKKTSLAYTMGKEDVSLVAKFEKEKMSVGCVGLSDGSFTAGVAGSPEGIPLEIETQSGVKSVKVEKLPAGMKYDAKKKVITGAPTKAGDNKVVITVTTVSGAVEKKEIAVPVAAMPETAVGTFNGFVANGEQRIGMFTLTTTDAGKLTAKVITAGGTVSFSGTCWDSLEDGVCKVTLRTKKGEFMTLALDSGAAWDANQLTGTYSPPNMTGWFDLSAQRNAFGKTWYFTAVGDEQTGWTFAYTKDAKAAALTVTLKADGSTAIAGKLGSIKISASGYADVSGMREGAILADFAPVVTVSKVKKVLSIHTNLWFDRSNDHGDGVGGAELVE